MAVTNVTFKIEKIKDSDYANRWTKKFVKEWQEAYLNIDGMEMSVYDEKSDFDNPFVEPLFDLSIYKAKVRQESEDLIVKTKAMKFVIRLDDQEEVSDWLDRFGRCNLVHENRFTNLLTSLRASVENLVSNQVSRRRTRNASKADFIE